jgi:hypothetical protein
MAAHQIIVLIMFLSELGFLQHKDLRAVQLINEMKCRGFSADVQTTKLVVDDDQATNHLLFFCVVVSYVFGD